MTELRRVVGAKFPDFRPDVEQLDKLLRRYARWVQLGEIDVTVSPDPDDNMFIETALLGNCSYIISGDRHLLGLNQYEDIKIIKPAVFLKLIKDT